MQQATCANADLGLYERAETWRAASHGRRFLRCPAWLGRRPQM